MINVELQFSISYAETKKREEKNRHGNDVLSSSYSLQLTWEEDA